MTQRLKYNRLKAVLSDTGKTNQELADHLGKTVFMITRWNTNRSQPTIPDLYRIAEFLGVDVYDLLEKKPRLIDPPKRGIKKP